MPFGYFSDGNSRYIAEARQADGTLIYRKYTSSDRWNYLFNLIPETECGCVFRARTITTEEDKRLGVVAKKKILPYISRELMKLMGKDPIPERARNQRILANYGREGSVVETDNERKPLGPQLAEVVDPETLPGAYKPVTNSMELSDEIRKELLEAHQFPQSEAAPDEFDMEAFKSGNLHVPESIVREEPMQPPREMADAMAAAPASPIDDQFAVEGEKEPRSSRIKRKGK